MKLFEKYDVRGHFLVERNGEKDLVQALHYDAENDKLLGTSLISNIDVNDNALAEETSLEELAEKLNAFEFGEEEIIKNYRLVYENGGVAILEGDLLEILKNEEDDENIEENRVKGVLIIDGKDLYIKENSGELHPFTSLGQVLAISDNPEIEEIFKDELAKLEDGAND